MNLVGRRMLTYQNSQLRKDLAPATTNLNCALISNCLEAQRTRPFCACSLEGRRFSEADWSRFIHTASNELILPALQRAFTDLGLEDDLPPEIADFLSSVTQLNRERNRRILDDLKSICALLNQHGIEPVVLKGTAHLLAGIYPDCGTRFLADIDLLISEEDFSAALAALRTLDYVSEETDPVELTIGHAYPPLRRSNSAEIDLHRNLGLGSCKSFLSASEVLRDSVRQDFEGVRLRVPCPEHLITHHLMHSQMHDSYRDRIWPSLRSLYDLALLQETFGDKANWKSIGSRFSKHKQTNLLVMHLLHAQEVFGFDPPVASGKNAGLALRTLRRKVLRSAPRLRFVDPLYLLLAGFLPRTRRLQEILNVPGGWKYLAKKFVSPKFYARLRSDLR